MTEQTIKMPDMSQLVVSSSPHYHDRDSVRKIMFKVIGALTPAALASVYFFGWRALMVILLCMVSCAAFEALFTRMMGRESALNDGSALLTGMLLGMNLPVTVPVWMCIVGSLAAIGLGKMVYGGLGGNPFNPALVGRVALLVGCPAAMTTWVKPSGCGFAKWVDAATGATPLALIAHCDATSGATRQAADAVAQQYPSVLDLFVGNCGGSLGETCAIALIIGGIFLICVNIIRWQVPVCYIGTVALFTGIAYAFHPCAHFNPLLHILSGGLMLGAFFMATDMVTTPLNRKGSVVFAVGCGVLTSVIRLWGSYPEGVSFSILIMNALTPLIDKFTAGRPFGVMKVGRRASSKEIEAEKNPTKK